MNYISIKKQNFGRINDKISFIISLGIFLLGLMGFYMNWKNGLCSITVMACSYFLIKYKVLKIPLIILIIIFPLIGFSLYTHFNFIEILITTIFLSFFFFLKSSYQEGKIKDEFEIFFINNKELKCISVEDQNYKNYAFNPKSYLKSYPIKNIKAFSFEEKNIKIIVGNKIIRSRELNDENIQEIHDFIKYKFPYLLENEVDFNDYLKFENKYYLHQFLIFSPVIIFYLAICFFADNGKDKMLTNVFLIFMFGLPFIIYKVLKKNKFN